MGTEERHHLPNDEVHWIVQPNLVDCSLQRDPVLGVTSRSPGERNVQVKSGALSDAPFIRTPCKVWAAGQQRSRAEGGAIEYDNAHMDSPASRARRHRTPKGHRRKFPVLYENDRQLRAVTAGIKVRRAYFHSHDDSQCRESQPSGGAETRGFGTARIVGPAAGTATETATVARSALRWRRC